MTSILVVMLVQQVWNADDGVGDKFTNFEKPKSVADSCETE